MVTLTLPLANWVIFKKKKKKSIYLFLAALGLHCCSSSPLVVATGGYSSWDAQASHLGGFSHCGPQALGAPASVAMAHGLSWSAGSSWTKDRTHVFCTGRQVLNQWATMQVPTGWPWTTPEVSEAHMVSVRGNEIMHACSVVFNSTIPWTVARQAPLSMGFSRQEYRSGLPFPGSSQPRDRTHVSCASCVAGGVFTVEPPGKPMHIKLSAKQIFGK